MADDTMADDNAVWSALPTETEIYILPNGEIVVADLPAELAASMAQLMQLAAVAPSNDETAETPEAPSESINPPHVAN